MLTLNGVIVHLQNFGSILCIHLVGTSKAAIEERYFSFYNHETTGGELEWENEVHEPYHAFFWVYGGKMPAEEKLQLGLTRSALFEMLPPNSHYSTKGRDIWPEACRVGAERMQQIDHVMWFHMHTAVEAYSLGDTVTAEKNTGNFDDDVLGQVVSHGIGSLEITQVTHTENEQFTPEEEEESVGQDV